MEKYLFDVAIDGQLGFQDAATPVMESLVNFYNYVFIYMTLVMVVVGYMLSTILVHFNAGARLISHKYLTHGTQIEVI
ncbi:MAG: hypothetical protein JSS34_07460 [Proteobacteria bacterium]|nr:hypothetical protein [Pseudomonadota bacterium]